MEKKIIKFTSLTKPIITLKEVDEPLAKLITLIGDIELTIKANYFESLVMSIIGQQLSTKAAKTIRTRVLSLCPDISIHSFKTLLPDQLRNVGVSSAKTAYIFGLYENIISKKIDFENIDSFGNDNVLKELTKINGIGKWTAEMFMIFSLGRLDVLSFGDAGLQRACKWLYNMPEHPKGKYLEQQGTKWNPYQSVVSLYLWKAIDLGYVDSGIDINELYNKN